MKKTLLLAVSALALAAQLAGPLHADPLGLAVVGSYAYVGRRTA
ncbi:MAG: hypothetical protein WD278_12520 [Pirellulales bacterium]